MELLNFESQKASSTERHRLMKYKYCRLEEFASDTYKVLLFGGKGSV